MGSGLILLVIVGAWLAVLVPMALRSHDAANALGTVERFSDAMRVLSRRDGRGRGPDPDPKSPDTAPKPTLEEPDAGEPRPRRAAVSPSVAHARRTAARRRRNTLLVLLALAVATLVAAVLGPLWLLAPHLLADLLLVAFVVHLRTQALLRAERERYTAAAPVRRPAPRQEQPCAVKQAVHVAGVPDRMPPRPAPLVAPQPAPAAEHADVPAARGAQGEAWLPVPVPAPTYLSAPAAPRHVLDLTGAGSNDLAAAERDLGIVDEGPQLDEILERRRAVNEW